MSSIPYIVNGTIKKSNGEVAENAIIKFTISNSHYAISDSLGHYSFDLANIDYESGDTVNYICEDEFKNESYSGSFVVSGESLTLNLMMSSRSYPNPPPANRDVQIVNIGGQHVSWDNPFPITQTRVLNSHPEVVGNCDTTWTITRSDGQPDTETVTFPDGEMQKRTFSYDSNNQVIFKSRWEKV